MNRLLIFSAAIALASLTGCEWMPGRPKLENVRPEPKQITSFETLFHQNCRGCHGDGVNVAGSMPMDDPLYVTIIPKEILRQTIAHGVPKTRMPGFVESEGGRLTEAQIDILVEGISAWAKGATLAPNMPPYSSALGDPVRGATAFGVYCASCHGADGNGVAGKAGPLANAAYLGLVSDQYLRTITIVGRPDLGCPDFQNRVPGKAMSNEEISDVVAWLVSQRKNEFGQPLPAASQQ